MTHIRRRNERARQILEAFLFETAPKYLLLDRDGVYGGAFHQQVAVMNIKEVRSVDVRQVANRIAWPFKQER